MWQRESSALAVSWCPFQGLRALLKEHPQQPIRHSLLVRDLPASGQTEKALKTYYRFHQAGGTFSEELFLEIVRGALNHTDIAVRHTTIRTLGELGDCYSCFKKALDSDHGKAPIHAAAALIKLGDKGGIIALENALNDDDRWARMFATKALGELRDKSVIPALIDALNDDDEWVRFNAAIALGKLGDKRAVPTFMEAIGDDNKRPDVKIRVIQALVKLNR